MKITAIYGTSHAGSTVLLARILMQSLPQDNRVHFRSFFSHRISVTSAAAAAHALKPANPYASRHPHSSSLFYRQSTHPTLFFWPVRCMLTM